MSARQGLGPYASVSRKWLALAEQRKLHVIDMYDSGRWRRYFTEEQMLAEMRNAIEACNTWARLLGVEPHAVPEYVSAAVPPAREPKPEPDAYGYFEADAAA